MDYTRDGIERFLADVRLELLRILDEGGEPVSVTFHRVRGRQIGATVWWPEPPPKWCDELPPTIEDKPPLEDQLLPGSDDTVPEGWTPEAADRETTATEDAILTVLQEAEAPIKITTIARRAGVMCTDHFRKSVYGLRRKEKIIQAVEHKYWLADRPLPGNLTNPKNPPSDIPKGG